MTQASKLKVMSSGGWKLDVKLVDQPMIEVDSMRIKAVRSTITASVENRLLDWSSGGLLSISIVLISDSS